MNVFGKIHALNLRAMEILKNRLSSGVCKDGGYEGRKSFCYCRRKGRKRTGKRAVLSFDYAGGRTHKKY